MFPAKVSSYVFALLMLSTGYRGYAGGGHPEQPGALSPVHFRLSSQPAEGYQAVQLYLDRVEVKIGASYQLLAAPQRFIDAQNLAGEIWDLEGVQPLDADQITHLRLHLDADRNTVTLAGTGAVQPLLLPEVLKAGLVVPVQRNPTSTNARHAFVLALDLSRSLQKTERGIFLRPWITALDTAQTGTVSGRLVDERFKPLPGVQVTAQLAEPDTGDGSGPVLARSARTGPDGSYRLDLLPTLGRVYHVAAMPCIGERVFKAGASEPIHFQEKEDKRACYCLFQELGAAGSARVHVPSKSECASDHVLVDLLQHTSNGRFIVQSALAAPAKGEAVCVFERLPIGQYEARCTFVHWFPERGANTLVMAKVQSFSVDARIETDVRF